MAKSIPKGKRYGKLKIIKEVDKFVQPSGQTQRGFLCKCDCGNTKRVRLSHLEHNRVNSCGCLAGEFHGEINTRLYNVWRGMKNRSKEYHSESQYYSDRGIGIYSEWEHSFLTFKKWAIENGFKNNLTIDRIDNDKGYYPENCRFVPQYINNANRRNTMMVDYKGREVAFTLLIKEKGLKKHEAAIRSRINRGWDVQKAFDIPIREGNYYRTSN